MCTFMAVSSRPFRLFGFSGWVCGWVSISPLKVLLLAGDLNTAQHFHVCGTCRTLRLWGGLLLHFPKRKGSWTIVD